ncbi:hypothetical protein WB401_25640 [Streptomyces brasiliscabiei]|uniref:Transcriptional regulator n=1 Tax=Streptomyces brasiliscabiei TaxID=2736302 RepID=A0ABU8GIU3_9ACTN
MADRRKTPNTRLRVMREGDFQMSRQEFAQLVVATGEEIGEVVACSSRLVAAWEDGEVRLPRGVYRRILTRLTGRTMKDLGFRLDSSEEHFTPAVAAGRPTQQSSVDRRSFLTDSAGAAMALFPVTIAESLQNPQGKIGASDVRRLHRTIGTIYAYDHDHGSSALLRSDASKALNTAYNWLESGAFTEATGRRLRSTTGHLSIAAGWLSYDSGRAADARSLYSEALAAARLADDPGLEGHAFGCLSLLAKASGRPREAVSAAQGAQNAVRTYGSARMLSLFSLREAGGWALLGDAEATDRAIVRAHDLYAKGPSEADPDWLEFYTPAELAGLEALARADLDQHERAAAGAEQAVMLHGDRFTRNKALYTADVAIQHAVSNRPEPEAAAEAAQRVLAYVPQVRSDRLLQQLQNVESALQRHARLPSVADWLEEYRTIVRTG